MHINTLFSALLLTASLPFASAAALVGDGQTVAFLGDSITQQGAATPGGYVRLVASGLAANGIKIEVLPAGVSGHKSNQMLARLPEILAKKPDWLTLSCGVNDVWHGQRGQGVSLEDYKANITAIVDRCQAAGVKVLIFTATQIKLPVTNELNVQLAGYNAFLRELAAQRNLPLADLAAAMLAEQEALAAAGLDRALTTDGVHMNIYGNLMIAKAVLAAFGLDQAGIAAAGEAWLDTRDTYQTNIPVRLTLRELARLEAFAAAEKKKDAQDLINHRVRATVRDALQSAADK